LSCGPRGVGRRARTSESPVVDSPGVPAILERAVIGKILTHLGLEPQPPPRSKAGEAGLEFAA
jgi:hypothetical protein